MAICSHCNRSVGASDVICNNCGERLNPETASFGARRRAPATIAASDGSANAPPLSPTSDVEAQRIEVEAAEAKLASLTNAPSERRRDILRVSPFAFFVIPTIFFYVSAVLASYSLHFGNGEHDCVPKMRYFLWGAILLGYIFLCGFGWMIVGPVVRDLKLKWGVLFVYTVLLGILTAMGADMLLDPNKTDACVSSVWYRTCWVVTGFYCIFWIVLFVAVCWEVGRALFCPLPGRVVIMGVGAGFNTLHLKPLSKDKFISSIVDRFPTKKKKENKQQQEAQAALAASANKKNEKLPKLDARQQAELELAALEDPTRSPDDTLIRKDNFFGSELTEKRKAKDNKDEENDGDSSDRKRRSVTMNLKNTSVAPSPEESKKSIESDDEDTPTKRRRKKAEKERAQALAQAGSELEQWRLEQQQKEKEKEDGLLKGPTPFEGRKQPLPPLNSNRVADLEDHEEHDDPFAAKIKANQAASAARRREMEDLERASNDLMMKRTGITINKDIQPMPQLSPSIASPSGNIDRDPSPAPPTSLHISTSPSAASPLPSGGGPISILKNPGAASDKFKMVDWPSESRLEEVQHVQEAKYEDSLGSNSQRSENPLSDRSDLGGFYANQQQPPLPFDPYTPVKPAYAYSSGPAPLPPALFNPSSMPAQSPPLPSSSTFIPAGPVYPDANDPNRFSKLRQMQLTQQQQGGQQQQQPSRPPPNPIRYHMIPDDEEL